MAKVVLENLMKRFGDNVVIQDLNIEIQDSEFIVFVGPSGSGKSTILRIIAGLESLTSGEIRIGDRVVNKLSPRERDIAMDFRIYALFPHMSVFDNMSCGRRKRRVDKDKIEPRVRDTARSLEIEEFLERRPAEPSGGQQRVTLGRAIVRQAQAFLLDEPLSNLDAKHRVGARAFLSDLHNELQATFICVTHDQVEAMTMGDCIAVLGRQYLQQIDTPEHLPRKTQRQARGRQHRCRTKDLASSTKLKNPSL